MDRPLFTLDDVRPLSSASRVDTAKERRAHSQLKGKYDLDLLNDCARSWINKDPVRQERARVLKYLFGNQWGEYIHVHGLGNMTEEDWIKAQGSVPLSNNVMVSLWMTVFGLHAKQETEPICYARTEDSKALSDMMSAALQTNWQNTYMSESLDSTFAEYLISGMAFAKESYEEREELNDSYTDYINPYYMFWEAGNDPAHRDIRMIGCLCDISREDLYFRFAKPEYHLTIKDLDEIYSLGGRNTIPLGISFNQQNETNSYDNVSFYTPSDPSLCRVIEVWREEVKPRYQCFDPLATNQVDKYFRCEKEDLPKVLEINKERKAMYDSMPEPVPVEKRAYITAKAIVDKYWQYTFMAPDGRILCTGETPYDFKSHPFSVSLFPYINGEIHPFMAFFIDQQRYINRMVTVGDSAINNAAKGMTFLPLSLKPDNMTEEEYANQKSRFNAVYVYDDRKALRTGAEPKFYTHSAFNLGHTEMLQLQLNMIHEVSGVQGAIQGKTPQSGTSAARYAQEAQNSTTTIYPLVKKFTGFKERCAQKKCIVIQQFYNDGRDITPNKSDHQVFYKANAARDVKFRVSIKDSAASAAYLQLGNEMLDKLLERGLDMRTYLKNYDSPYSEKILQDLDNYMAQVQQGQQPAGPVQVPGANQQQTQLASQLMLGAGNLYTRTDPGQPLKAAS